MRPSLVCRVMIGTAAVAMVSTLAWAQAVPVKIVPITAVPAGSGTPASPPPAAPQPAPSTPQPARTSAPAQPAKPVPPPMATPMPPAPAPLATTSATSATTPPARRLQLSFSNGAVTLVAAQVTVREILQEWARLGGTRVVDGEKLSGGPVTLEFHHAPEAAVIATLLREAAGYLTVPRQTPVADASIYQRIAILPVSRPTAAGFAPPQPVYQPIANPDDSIPPVIPPGLTMPSPQVPTAGPRAPAVVIAPVTPVAPVKPGGGGGGSGGGV